jgi:outer membrane receptor protein involved in Fe transport
MKISAGLYISSGGLALAALMGSAAAAQVSSSGSAPAGPTDTVTATNGAGATNAPEMDDIRVTARRVEERAQTVPLSIVAFDEEALHSANIATATDLQRIPGERH